MNDVQSASRRDHLYGLLPAIIRRRDAEEGAPLRALLDVIADEAAVVERDIAGLYRNWFIETCDEWVVPYLADLVAHRLPVGRRGALGRNPRQEVAKALSYRRRSGITPLLTELAQDVTGWPARVVEFGAMLCTTAARNHRRPAASTVMVRNRGELRKLDGPFDTTPRLASVRAAPGQWYRRQSVALYVWRTSVRRVTLGEAQRVNEEGTRFTFDPFGGDAPLYLRPDARTSSSADASADATLGVPNPIAPRHLREPMANGERGASTEVYGPHASLAIFTGEEEPILVQADQIRYADLKHWTPPTGGRIAVDPALGRILFPEKVGTVRATWHLTGPWGIGAGNTSQVDRVAVATILDSSTPGATAGAAAPLRMSVNRGSGDIRSLADAISRPRDRSAGLVIEITDSGTYDFSSYEPASAYKTEAGGRLVIRAAAGTRPAIRHATAPDVPWNIDAAEGSEIVLDGLLVRGALAIAGKGNVTLRNCTLLAPPAKAASALIVDATIDSLRIERCIVGAITYANTGEAADSAALSLTDSIVDSINGTDDAAVRLDIRRCTVFGRTHVRHLDLAENSIFMGAVRVRHRQAGGMRFCFVAMGSQTPRRYECEPDKSGRAPKFISKLYGRPGFGVLAEDCPPAITEGADDDGEMGALHDSFDFRRLSDLKARVADFIPAGFDLRVVPVSPGSATETRS